jgi:Protein of unknown function (DUF3276)
VGYDNNFNERKNDSVFSKKIKAGKRRTYFFDIRSTKSSDYFLTITESVKKFDAEGYDRHKIFIYKEDFNKFAEALTETIDHVKVELMPDFDFDAFNYNPDLDENAHKYDAEGASISNTNANDIILDSTNTSSDYLNPEP